MPIGQERRLWVQLAETALGEITEIRAQDHIEFAGRKIAHCGSLRRAAEPRPDPLDDLCVGLGEFAVVYGAGLGVVLDVAQHPQ